MEKSAAELYITLKDHRLEEPMRLMIMNKIRMIRQAASESGYDLNQVALKKQCHPVNIIITNHMDSSIKKLLANNIKCLARYNMKYSLECDDTEGMLYFYVWS